MSVFRKIVLKVYLALTSTAAFALNFVGEAPVRGPSLKKRLSKN